MNHFDVHILGCGSALPTLHHYPSCQVVNAHEKYFMIDCGEGAQLQYRKQKLGFGKLNQIFVTHAHGDHCFGLIGLISTLGLLGRTGDLIVHCVPGLKPLLQAQLDFFCQGMSYKVIINTFNPDRSEVIFENKTIKVNTIPLEHRVPCAGFFIQEKQGLPHLIKEMLEFYNIPIRNRAEIIQGADFVTEDGTVIPHRRLTRPASPARSYAYCSDTAYSEKVIPIIEGADLLYHEATFTEADQKRAAMTGHSTARQAALIAKQANVKKLMLGHFSSRYNNHHILLDEARKIFKNTILANEGLCEPIK
jgi:ribonuclease Z